jgi:hypothetical protein
MLPWVWCFLRDTDGRNTPKKMHLKGANSKCNNRVPLMKIIVERRTKSDVATRITSEAEKKWI